MDAVIFFVLFGLALIVRWLTKQGGDRSDELESSATPPSRAASPDETDEERIRRFLEALGVPKGTSLPPKVQPRPRPPRHVVAPKAPPVPPKVKRSWVQPLPPLVTVPTEPEAPPPQPTIGPAEAVVVEIPPPLPVVVTLPEGRPTIKERRTVAPKITLRPPVRLGSLGTLLRSPASLRQAIVLREVLGAPRAFEPIAFR